MWGDDLEASYHRGMVIKGAVDQARWRADEVEMLMKDKEAFEPSQWAWAIHCKEIEEEAFSS